MSIKYIKKAAKETIENNVIRCRVGLCVSISHISVLREVWLWDSVVEDTVLSHVVIIRSIERESRATFTVSPPIESVDCVISNSCRLRLSLDKDETRCCFVTTELLSDTLLYCELAETCWFELHPHAIRHIQQRGIMFNLVVMV